MRWPSSTRRAAGASSFGSTSRSRPGSAAVARTPQRRSGSRTPSSSNPWRRRELHALAARIGADVPFFLADGPQLGTGDGTELEPLDLPQDFTVLLVLPHGATKRSTADVYDAFDARGGPAGFAERAAVVRAALAAVRRPRDLAALPANDLASSPVSERLRSLGAFRADVSGAGPTVYGLFQHRTDARRAGEPSAALGRTWITVPAWYG